MKRSQREAARARADGRKQYASDQKQADRAKQEEQQRAALARLHAPSRELEERQLRELAPGARDLIGQLLQGPATLRKLVSREARVGLVRLGGLPHLRPFNEWAPAGKGRETLFRSLCTHLLARYPTPPFLWSALHEPDSAAKVLVPLVVHVAGGGSLFQFCRDGGLPFLLTRAQCAEFMKTEASYGVLDALRRVQVMSEGGDRRLFEVWRRQRRSKDLNSPQVEAFGLSVLRFLARNPMLSREQVAPVCDYLYHRYQQSPTGFIMQGRTANAVLRDMGAWHRELNSSRADRDRPPVNFARSGFRAYRVERSDPQAGAGKNGFSSTKTWSIREVLSSLALRDEGKAMGHCVYSYRDRVEAGGTSIWSLTTEDGFQTEKLVTLEVDNAVRAVVQARGKRNRKTTPLENKVIVEWGAMNRFTLSYGSHW